MLQKVTPVYLLSQTEQLAKIQFALQSAQDFDFSQGTIPSIKKLHQLLCEAVELCKSSSWNNQFVLAELKSRRLACACRIEVLEASYQK